MISYHVTDQSEKRKSQYRQTVLCNLDRRLDIFDPLLKCFCRPSYTVCAFIFDAQTVILGSESTTVASAQTVASW